ncbi:unnamed protein product [Cyprideis torosa]|uniref:Uncharacterized protein n=1 Tax=Cyprideis torosa TaxID=163714 RepID=A0A7R8W585_9CRUS|nr:unnamed protein product [Cyprideis torosa]CAG0880618.1 unnamed protein product [Cyprideis torosa]
MEGLSQALSLIMALVLSAMASQDNIRISENGYQSILIAFKHDVPKNQCPLLISNLEIRQGWNQGWQIRREGFPADSPWELAQKQK